MFQWRHMLAFVLADMAGVYQPISRSGPSFCLYSKYGSTMILFGQLRYEWWICIYTSDADRKLMHRKLALSDAVHVKQQAA